jgi:uncharacterized delta-60 repeat protein
MKIFSLTAIIIFYGQFLFSQVKLTDTTFNIGKGFKGTVKVIKELEDGKIIVGGGFSSFNETEVNGIVKLNKDGTLDSTFKNSLPFATSINSIAVQKDGKIIVGGLFVDHNRSSNNSFNPQNIVRLNQDGELDSSFNTGTGFTPMVNVICIQKDGKILVGGDFKSFKGKKSPHLVRLNSNGSLDESFQIQEKNDKIVFDILIQPDGKIVTSGRLKYLDYKRNKLIQRFYTNGTLDSTFNVGRQFMSDVWRIIQLSDGKFIAAGLGINHNDSTQVCLLTKLNNDGSYERTFLAPRGFSNIVYDIAPYTKGRFVISGDFSRIGDQTQKYMGIAILHNDGSIDSSFNKDIDFTINVRAICVLRDNNLIIGGDEGRFTFGGEGRKNISRILYKE